MDGWNTSVCFCDFILSSRANLLLVSRVSVCWDDFCLAQLMHVAGLSWVLSLVRRDDIKHIPTTSHLHFWTGILGQLISDILVIISSIFCKCSSFLGVRNKIWQTSKKDGYQCVGLGVSNSKCAQTIEKFVEPWGSKKVGPLQYMFHGFRTGHFWTGWISVTYIP